MRTYGRTYVEQRIETPPNIVSGLGDIGIGTWTWDPVADTVHWDAATEAVYGLEPGAFDKTFDAFVALVHPDDRDDVLETINRAATEGGDYSVRHRIVRPDGVIRWIEGQGRISVDDQGNPVAGVGIVYDLTNRMTFDRERADLSAGRESAIADSAATRERLRFLIDLTDAISGSLNTERVARQLVAIISDRLADACLVDIQLQEPYGHMLTCIGTSLGKQVVTTGTSAEMRNAAARLEAVTSPGPIEPGLLEPDDESQADVLAVNDARTLAVPLVSHGSRIGTLVAIRRERGWSAESTELVAAACRRASGAFDRAELHADRAKFVAMFQAAATPRDLPDVPGLELAVHYRPATDLVRLGGDLYDIIRLGDGSWMLAVGDVCGKGIRAAGHAELARTALRAAALATADPTETLQVLNRTLLVEPSRPMLTAALVRIDPADATGELTVEVAVAGHPPPIVVNGENAWHPVNAEGTMLGVHADAKFGTERIRLAEGNSIALYTDGVTESRFGETFFGESRLGRTLSEAWPASAKALVAGVGSAIETWAAGNPTDDLLLLVARVAHG